MKTTRDGKARANRECDRPTRRCAEVPTTVIVKVLHPIVVLAMASMALGTGVALAEPVVSTAGYYEGHVRYGTEYYKDRPLMSMNLKSKADFWFVVLPSGDFQGEGLAFYDFDFAIDWGMAATMGISLMNALNVKIEPNVSLTLDSSTAVHKFYLSGQVAPGSPPTMDMRVSWTPVDKPDAQPPELHINLVGTLTASAGVPVAQSGTGGTLEVGTVLQTIKWTPIPPFGTDKVEVDLRKRSRYGPYAVEFEFDGPGTAEGVGVSVSWQVVQKIDFSRAQLLAELSERLDELMGGLASDRGREPGAKGDKGDPGPAGPRGPTGEKGDSGDSSAYGPELNWRAGTVSTEVGRSTSIVFETALPDENYIVSLTPESLKPSRWIVGYANKTPSGFDILVAPSKLDEPQSATVQVDWLAVPANSSGVSAAKQ